MHDIWHSNMSSEDNYKIEIYETFLRFLWTILYCIIHNKDTNRAFILPMTDSWRILNITIFSNFVRQSKTQYHHLICSFKRVKYTNKTQPICWITQAGCADLAQKMNELVWCVSRVLNFVLEITIIVRLEIKSSDTEKTFRSSTKRENLSLSP